MPKVVGYEVRSKALKSKKNKDAIVRSQELLKQGKNYREQERESVWKRSQKQYTGKYSVDQADATADQIVVNISYSTVNTILPFITGEEPRFLVEPYSGDAAMENATILASWLNKVWRSSDVAAQRETISAAKDTLILGDGYLHVGYEMTEIPTGDDTLTMEEIAELFVLRLSPWDVWVDPASDGIHNARWVCVRYTVPLREWEDDSRMAFHKEAASGYRHWRPDQEGYSIESEGAGEPWVVYYDFYDTIDNTLYTFTDNFEYPHRMIQGITRLPIVPLPNHSIPNSPYHMGDLEQLWHLQLELNKVRSEMATHRRRNIVKYAAREKALDDSAEAALRSPVIGEVVKIKSDEPLGDVFQPLGVTSLSEGPYAMSETILNDVFEISGVNEYLRGATPEIRRTATEATIIEGASNVKTRHKLAIVESATRQCGQLMLEIASDVFPLTAYEEMQLFITQPESEALNRAELGKTLEGVSQLPSAQPQDLQLLSTAIETGGPAVVTLEPQVFNGVYQVEVEQGSTELRNPVFKEQKFRELALSLTELAPLLAQMDVHLDMKRVLTLWFEAANIPDVGGIFSQGPTSMEQKSQQEEQFGQAERQLGLAERQQAMQLAAMQAQQPQEQQPLQGQPAPGGGGEDTAAADAQAELEMLEAQEAQAGVGPPQGEGPNLMGAEPPLAPITEDTSGMFGPIA